jgi:cytochrome c oxidase subunit 2
MARGVEGTPGPRTLQIDVTGEQWWWRVRYERPGGETIDAANEVRLPLGERVTVRLSSDNVIHSFWIPSLAGKMDMVPGRDTRLSLEPLRLGIYRGVCAEYCGTSHAKMAFDVAVLDRAAFDRWLDGQARPAGDPIDARAVEGRRLFLANGCGACHTIRGTAAAGTIGPDLTHVGTRFSLAAGALTNTAAHLAAWIERPSRIKPGARMPPFAGIARADREAIAAFLHGLP